MFILCTLQKLKKNRYSRKCVAYIEGLGDRSTDKVLTHCTNSLNLEIKNNGCCSGQDRLLLCFIVASES